MPLEKDLIEQAFRQGNIMIGPMPGADEQCRMVISNCIKKGDNMTLVISKAERNPSSISVEPYI
jgi:hypothetical protein